MKIEILTLTTLSSDAQKDLEARFDVHSLQQAEDPDALLDRVGRNIRGVLTIGNKPVDAALLDRLPNLEVVSCASAGYDGIKVKELAQRGIRLGNVSTALEDDVADTAILLAMAARRDLLRGHDHVVSGKWQEGSYPLLKSFSGGRLGIAGLGRIGQCVAQRAEAFGKEIGYTARSAKKEVSARYFDDMASLAEWSDTLVVCLPGGEATRDAINAEVLKALGPQGVLVNVGRGSVVDEAALIEALTSGAIAAAGLDVFEGEPTPNPDLVGLPNVTCYPHHASGTKETRGAMAQMAVDNLAAVFEGKPMPCEVSLK